MTRLPSALGLLLAVLVAGGVYAVDLVIDPLPPAESTVVASDVEPVTGRWVCPVGDGHAGTETRVTMARPPSSATAPAQVEVDVLGDGERSSVAAAPVFPEAALTREVAADDGAALVVDWRDAPIAVHRQWMLTGQGEDRPAGIVAGACVEPFSKRWIIPGMDTSGGAQAFVRVANPFPTDATIAISFVGPEGPLDPIALRNLSVEGHGTLEIDVNEYLPERPDLSAIVTVASGRVAAEGYQLVRAAIGGIDGVSPLAAAGSASETWTVPWIVDGDDLASWLWVYNPGDRQALIELTYHTSEGGVVPTGLSEVVVEPGQMQRVDLRGTLPEDANVVAVTANSDGAPVVVSGAAQLRSDDAARSGFAVQLGAPGSDTSWTVSGGSTSDRTEQLHVINPAGVPATLSVGIFTGSTVERPDDLQQLTVPPGASRVLDLGDPLGDVEQWTAFVTTSAGEVVVGRVGSDGEGDRNLVAVPGVASSAWRTSAPGLPTQYDDGFVTRYATSLGLSRDDGPPDPLTGNGTDPSPELDGPPPDDDPPGSDLSEPPVDIPADDPLGQSDEGAGDPGVGETEGETDGETEGETDGEEQDADAVGDRLDQDLFGADPPDPAAPASDDEEPGDG